MVDPPGAVFLVIPAHTVVDVADKCGCNLVSKEDICFCCCPGMHDIQLLLFTQGVLVLRGMLDMREPSLNCSWSIV